MSHEKKTSLNILQVENLRSDILKLESQIQDLDESVDTLYMQLVKTWETVLNVSSI